MRVIKLSTKDYIDSFKQKIQVRIRRENIKRIEGQIKNETRKLGLVSFLQFDLYDRITI
jgi:hypothetical protein